MFEIYNSNNKIPENRYLEMNVKKEKKFLKKKALNIGNL